ncbi:hypothetical protein B0H12DRAFT_1240711 [Mycena haematopus]|nr:hypothetical protein B0H12DRAFT_1240711 [Mycena haematopus]
MSGVSAQEEILVKYFLGPWLIGSCLDLILMGVLACQFVNYYNWYPDDGRGLPVIVAVLCLLNVLKSAECFATLWIFFINHFGNILYDLQLSTTGWWDTSSPLMVAILDFYVQCYFCTRLWAVSKRWWVVAPIFSLFFFALVSMVIGTYYIKSAQEQQVTDWFAAHLGSVFGERNSDEGWATGDSNYRRPIAGDLILSVATAYFLIRTKKTVLSTQTAQLFNSLIPLTFQTAAPAALIAMFNLIFSQMYRTDQPLLGYVEIGFNLVLPKVYAISMMYTLNARRAIRTRMSGSRNESNSDGLSLGGRVHPRHTNGDVELGRIEVATHRETTRHVDVTDMFAPAHTLEDSKVRLSDPDQKVYGASTE